MKLKAPSGVGDPCVAGVTIVSRQGIYEVEAAVGALLIEAFGFVEVDADEPMKGAPAPASPPAPPGPASAPLPKLSLPAWRTKPAAKKP
jgi:hypothetical protein